MTWMMVNFPCSHGSINSPAPVISFGIQTQPARDYQRQKTYCGISMMTDLTLFLICRYKVWRTSWHLQWQKWGCQLLDSFAPLFCNQYSMNPTAKIWLDTDPTSWPGLIPSLYVSWKATNPKQLLLMSLVGSFCPSLPVYVLICVQDLICSTWNSPLVCPPSFPVDDLQLKKTNIICVSLCQISHRISFSSFSFAILYMPVYTSKDSAIPSENFQFGEYLPNFSIQLDTLDLDSWRKVLGTLCCRWFVAATASGTMLGVLGQPEAQAGKRKPPPPEEKKVEEDKGLSAYDQKLLASARRKEALKLSIEEKKAKGKSVASNLWPSNFLSSSSESYSWIV